MQIIRHLKFSLLLIAVLLLSACGGGGGGGEDFNLRGGDLSISGSASSIGIGDRVEVEVPIENVDFHGILVIVRFAASLSYIANTGGLTDSADQVERVYPVAGPEQSEYDGRKYVVFYFAREKFGDDNYATLSFHLRGVNRDTSAEIEVQSDLHDSKKEPAKEFSITKPLFTADDSISVEVFKQN